MITTVKSCQYRLVETTNLTKILILDEKSTYTWFNARAVGDILALTSKRFKPRNIISSGAYRLYQVKSDSNLTDLPQLELHAGEGRWQGYLLPPGLPNGARRRRIVPTNEIITKTTH